MGRYTFLLGALVAVGCSGEEPSGGDRALEKRMDALEADLTSANETIAGLSESDSETESRLGEIESQMADLDARVTVLEASVAEAASSLGSLEANVAAVLPAVDTLESSLSSLSGDIATLQTGLGGAESAIVSLDSRISALESDTTGLGESIDALFEGQASIASISFGSFTSLTGTDTTVHNLGSLTVDPPGPGRLFVILTGYAVFFGQGRSIDVGIGDSATALDVSIDVGELDGTGSLRVESAFAPTASYTTTGAPVTLYALLQGNSTYDAASVNVIPQQMTVLFVPETM